MINHPERITMAHIADIVSGKQQHISDYVNLDRVEIRYASRIVLKALKNKRKMEVKKI